MDTQTLHLCTLDFTAKIIFYLAVTKFGCSFLLYIQPLFITVNISSRSRAETLNMFLRCR